MLIPKEQLHGIGGYYVTLLMTDESDPNKAHICRRVGYDKDKGRRLSVTECSFGITRASNIAHPSYKKFRGYKDFLKMYALCPSCGDTDSFRKAFLEYIEFEFWLTIPRLIEEALSNG